MACEKFVGFDIEIRVVRSCACYFEIACVEFDGLELDLCGVKE